MCSSPEKDNLFSCQFSYYPLGDMDYLNTVSKVLDTIEESGLMFKVGHMSTVVRGELEKISELIKKITHLMGENKFILTMTLSNACPYSEKDFL